MNGEPWDVLANRIALLQVKWQYWKELFGTSESVDELNHACPSLFSILQESLLFDVLSSIARLLDKEKVSGRRTLVLSNVLPLVKDPKTRSQLNERLDVLKKSASPIILIRHKVLSHEDFFLATRQAEIDPMDRKQIDAVVREIAEFFIEAEREAGVSHVGTVDVIDCRGTGETLLWLLRKARPHLVEAKSTKNGVPAEQVPGTQSLFLLAVRPSI